MKEKKVIPLEFEGCQVACSPDGSHIAVGFVNGYVEVIEANNSTIIKKMKDRNVKITLMKYSSSTDNVYLAVGAEDNELIVYKVKENYKIVSKVKGLKQFPIAVDFSEDGKILQLVDNSFTLRYIDTVSGSKRPGFIFEHKDEKWSGWSSPIGWTVSGLFKNKADIEEITTMSLSPERKILAVGLINGDI